jgi:hypothetical protein
MTPTLSSTPRTDSVLFLLFTADAGYALTVTQTNVTWGGTNKASRTTGVPGMEIWVGRPTVGTTPGTVITITYGGTWPAAYVYEFTGVTGSIVQSYVKFITGSNNLPIPQTIGLPCSLLIAGAGMQAGGAGPTSISASSGGASWSSMFAGDGGVAWARPIGTTAQSVTFASSRTSSWSGFIVSIS